MKIVSIVLLSMVFIAGLFLVSCQKEEPAQQKEGAVQSGGYGEKAGEIVEQAKDTVAGYGQQAGEAVEQAKDTVAGYGQQAGEAVEQVKETAGGYGKQADDLIKGFGK
jgi:ABC-type transporter Mla subunit MlaD